MLMRPKHSLVRLLTPKAGNDDLYGFVGDDSRMTYLRAAITPEPKRSNNTIYKGAGLTDAVTLARRMKLPVSAREFPVPRNIFPVNSHRESNLTMITG
jgi:hypothetical protein